MFGRGEDGTASSPRQVTAILAAVVAAAVVVFSLGVMVGKRGTGDGAVQESPPAALPMDVPVQPPESVPETKTARVEEPPPAGSPKERPLPSEKLTFFDSLSGDPPPAPVQKRPAPKKKEPAPRKPAEGGGTVAAPVKAASASAADRIKRLMGPGIYHVQLSSTTNPSWAGALVERMKKKGITAKSTTVTIKGKLWYRIRVGTFADKDAARRAGDIFKAEMKIDTMVVGGN